MSAEIIDIETRKKRLKTTRPKMAQPKQKNTNIHGLSGREENIIKKLEELHKAGAFGVLGRLSEALYELILSREFVSSAKGLYARRYRAYALLGHNLDALIDLHNEGEVTPSQIAQLLRNSARQHGRYWRKKGKK